MQLYHYPPINILASFYAGNLKELDITVENIIIWITKTAQYSELCYALDFYERTDLSKALTIAKIMLIYYPTKKLFSFILRHKTPETEQMVIDYLIEHDPTDQFWTIANSYWLP